MLADIDHSIVFISVPSPSLHRLTLHFLSPHCACSTTLHDQPSLSSFFLSFLSFLSPFLSFSLSTLSSYLPSLPALIDALPLRLHHFHSATAHTLISSILRYNTSAATFTALPTIARPHLRSTMLITLRRPPALTAHLNCLPHSHPTLSILHIPIHSFTALAL